MVDGNHEHERVDGRSPETVIAERPVTVPRAIAIAFLLASVNLVPGAAAAEPLETRLDGRGPYLILATEAAARDYREAILEARKAHPGAAEGAFDPVGAFAKAREALGRIRPRYALVFLLPGEIDARVNWEWLRISTEVD